MNNNQMPYNYGPFNNNCNCMNEINELQRKIHNLENRIKRLENMIYSNNWGGFNNPTFLSNENRTYTTGNYML